MTLAGETVWQLGHGRSLSLGAHGHLMAIINCTPDSFSDGGRHAGVEAAVAHALACVEEGASILDIGGESTRPGAEPVSAQEEQARVLPVIEALSRQTEALISIDTYRAETARLAVAAGAHIVNDVYGLRYDARMAEVVATSGAGLVMMHTGRGRAAEKLDDVIADQDLFFSTSLKIADEAGIGRARIVLDPGFGFAKDREEDLALMARFEALQALGFPLLAGTSRKRFIGAITGRDVPADRDVGTAATTALLRIKGAHIFRVHAIAPNRDALLMADAMLAASLRQERHS
ncbi:dihydropteroate synthase [Rhizobium sp. SL86]|uniref:dihydropteroate synthase n=1 Tax=Rhizobium sp. SL86 TaxID=2995148 RepID=UPI002276E8D5|nr:dihydropteroate synthase [Rhizobium sp. SL86]MCY1668865.1 dihydropteroate synthase [Rhizobium sp. SL86]